VVAPKSRWEAVIYLPRPAEEVQKKSAGSKAIRLEST
jgi:hypothetical protein